MLSLPVLAFALGLGTYVWADQTLQEYLRDGNQLLYDGFLQLNFTASDLDSPNSPYAVVKGTKDHNQYFHFLGSPNHDSNSTPSILWGEVQDQVISVTIDSMSVFTAGNGAPQDGGGFLRSQLIAQNTTDNLNRIDFDTAIEEGLTAFHFSLKVDSENPLNYTREYRLMSIDLSDETQIFAVQTGTPPNTTLTGNDASMLRILSHSGNLLFQTPFGPRRWYNFAIVVNWEAITLQVFGSEDGCLLQNVTDVMDAKVQLEILL